MSMVYCKRCDQYQDSDYIDMVADPKDDTEMVCWECLTEEEREEEE